MKKAIKLIGFIALIAIILFTMIACGGGDDDDGNTATYTGSSGGVDYTLTVKKVVSFRYAAKSGDNYELTGGEKKSAGKVDSVSGDELTLKPSNGATFKATVSENSLTKLDGTITWTDGTTAAAPGTLTAGTTSGSTDGNNTGSTDGNNTGGTTPGTGSGGTFTVTDIPAKYNGKYAMFTEENSSGTNPAIMGYQTMDTKSADFTFCLISNGKVSIPAWYAYYDADKIGKRYSGNDTFDIELGIYAAKTMSEFSKDPVNILKKGSAVGLFESVKFTNGSATVSWNDIVDLSEM